MTTKAQRVIKTPSERDCGEFVRREVLCCVSGIVNTLAGGYGLVTIDSPGTGRDSLKRGVGVHALMELCELAYELSGPVDDWEEAAHQAGWELDPLAASSGGVRKRTKSGEWEYAAGWEDAMSGGDPYQWDVFEHWAVTPYFADKLQAHGEKVERAFMGLNVWARTTTGQGIASDGVIQRIVKEAMNA